MATFRFLGFLAFLLSDELFPCEGAAQLPAVKAMNTMNSSGWGILEISPNAFMSIAYKSNFRISVYRSQTLEPNLAQYFYSPALIIDPSSAISSFNTFTKRFEVAFSVLMWDDEFEEYINRAISAEVGFAVPRSRVRTLPIEEIRIHATVHSDDYQIMNKWTSYASQPALFQFRLNCLRNQTCADQAEQIKQNPQYLVSEMLVSYSLSTQKSTRRVIKVKSEHVQAGNLFTTLEQRLPNKDIVYMKSDDVKKLTLEIAINVAATEVTDDEFVSQDQQLTISNLLETLLKVQSVSIASFESQMWDSVFWKDENARPDKITHSLNEVYNKSDGTLKEIIKREVASQISGSSSGSVGGGVSLGPITIGGSAEGSGSSSSGSMSSEMREKLITLLTEAKEVSQWNGMVFIPKPMQLSRVNLAALRASSIVTTTQVRVTKSTSELSSRINIMDSATTVGQMIHERNELNQFRKETEKRFSNLTNTGKLAETGTIRMLYSPVVPSGWLPCDGAAINCENCLELRQLIGNFTPDLRGRFPVGLSNSSSYASLLGANGGEAYHQLTIGEMPTHSHKMQETTVKETITDTHAGHWLFGGNSRWLQYTFPQSFSEGSSQPHNNLPPFIVVQFVIKM